MNRTTNSNRMLRIMVTTALTGALVSGCATGSGAPASVSASKAEAALAKGKHERAIAHAEAAVHADPRNAAYRAVLGAAYLDAGRFGSAATSFNDALQLGDDSPRTVLSLALALTGEGKHAGAAGLLNSREGEIPAADLGLALALAGQAERGIHVMGNAIRGGENTAKMRQNLAYAYALAGRWREARLMAAQDVPAGELPDRISEWAMLTRPEAAQERVAALLQVPAGISDAGQPVHLALANTPGVEQLAVEASASGAPETGESASLTAALAPLQAELPAVQPIAPAVEVARVETAEPPLRAEFEAAFAPAEPAGLSLASVVQDALSFVQSPVVQSAPARPAPAPVRSAPRQATVAQAAPLRAAPASAPAAQRAERTHLIQLGSFANQQSARRAWDVYVKKYPELSGHQMVISEAVVKGKRYWRVSAAGFGKSSSTAMCGKVRSSGNGCFAYSENRPLPGAVGGNVRLARR